MEKSTLSELYELAKSISAEMAGVAPSRRLYDQVTGNANPKAGFGLNRDTADWAADIINNLVGTAGPSLYAASVAPKAAKTLADLAAQSPKVNRYLPKEMANQSGLYRYAKPEDIKPGSNAFSARFDKKPRVEISDDMMDLVMPRQNLQGTKLGDILKHERLYQERPDFANKKIDITVHPSSAPAHGSYTKAYEGREGVSRAPLHVVAPSNKQGKSVLTHELQHALQEEGGLARGGSPEASALSSGIMDDINNISKSMDTLKDAISTGKKEATVYSSTSGEWQTISSDAFKYRYKKLMQDADELQNMAIKEGHYLNPYDRYNRLAGEFEARDAASRMDLTPEQRITTPPYSSENIPLEDLIVRMK